MSDINQEDARLNAFREFIRDRMDRQDVSCKELSARTGVSISTLKKYLQTKSAMPNIYVGLLIMEAFGSKHAKALLEIWRTWYLTYMNYFYLQKHRAEHYVDK